MADFPTAPTNKRTPIKLNALNSIFRKDNVQDDNWKLIEAKTYVQAFCLILIV